MTKDMEDANIDIPHLTLQSLWREIKHVRELMESRVETICFCATKETVRLAASSLAQVSICGFYVLALEEIFQ